MTRLSGSLRLRSGWRNRCPQDQNLCRIHRKLLRPAIRCGQRTEAVRVGWKSCMEGTEQFITRRKEFITRFSQVFLGYPSPNP